MRFKRNDVAEYLRISKTRLVLLMKLAGVPNRKRPRSEDLLLAAYYPLTEREVEAIMRQYFLIRGSEKRTRRKKSPA